MTLLQLISTVRRRRVLNTALRLAATGLAAAAVAAAVLLVAERLAGLAVIPWAYAVIVAAGGLLGVGAAIARRPGPDRVAVDLDRDLALQDRFGSALAMRRAEAHPADRPTPYDRTFAALVTADAERRARGLDARAVAPIRLTRHWAVAAGTVALLAAGVLLLPRRGAAERVDDVAIEGTSPQPTAPPPQREALVDALNTIEADPEIAEAFPEEIDALDELAEQLADPSLTDEDARRLADTSAARLSELADEMAEQASRDLEATEEIARRFSKRARPEEGPMEARDFAEALERGDFGDAAELLEEWIESTRSLPEEERREAAEALRRLGESIDAAGDPDAPPIDERAEQLEQALRDQGLDETAISDMLEGEDADAVEQALRERGTADDIARDIARDVDELRRRREIEEQVEQEAGEIADALESAAEELESPPGPDDRTETHDTPDQNRQEETPQPSPTGAPQQQQQQEAPETSETPTPQQSPNGAPQQQQQEAPEASETPTPQPSPNGAPQQQQQEAPEASETPTPQPSPNGAPQQQQQEALETSETPTPQPSPNGAPQQQQQEAPETSETPTPQPSPNGAPQQQQQQESPRGSETPTPRKSPTDAPTDQPTGEEPAGSRPSPAETLRDLARRREGAEQRRETSEALQRRAREMLEGADPEQRRRWAEQWAREQGRGGDAREPGTEPGASDEAPGDAPPVEETTTLDLRGDEPTERTIAEWLSDEPPAGPGDRPGRAVRQRVKSAQRVAERAVEDSAIPSRYHRLVKRYFERLPDTVESASGKGGGDE